MCLEVVQTEDAFVFPVGRAWAAWAREYSGLVSSRLTGLLRELYTLRERNRIPTEHVGQTGREHLSCIRSLKRT